MSLNGNIKRMGMIGLVLGGVMAFSVFLIIYNLNLPNGTLPPQENLVGERIAARMAAAEENISYVWCYNNSFVNFNLSEYYSPLYIDGVSIGRSLNSSVVMALIHEPLAEIEEVSQSSLNSVMAGFRTAVSNIGDYSQITNIDDIWPPDFLIDIGYEDGTSFSLVYSKEEQVLSFLNGTWELAPFYRYGIQVLMFNYEFFDAVFLEIENDQYILAALQTFETWIHEIFP